MTLDRFDRSAERSNLRTDRKQLVSLDDMQGARVCTADNTNKTPQSLDFGNMHDLYGQDPVDRLANKGKCGNGDGHADGQHQGGDDGHKHRHHRHHRHGHHPGHGDDGGHDNGNGHGGGGAGGGGGGDGGGGDGGGGDGGGGGGGGGGDGSWPHGFLFGGNAHNSLSSLESAIGGRANLEMFPVHPGNAAEMQHVRDDVAHGVTPEISLNGEFFDGGSRAIASGQYDRQLTQMARDLSQMRDQSGNQADMLMRFGKEMNLQHSFVGSGADFVAAYQHVADIFHREAPNVKMVWCPTKKVDPSGLTDQADPSHYWPGSRYVDVIGPDGYSSLHGREQSFQQIFEPFMQMADRLNKPFMTSETNVKTPLSDAQSAQWWRDAFDYVNQQRRNGLDVLGIGVFARNEGEVLSAAEQQMLRQTFIRQEGT